MMTGEAVSHLLPLTARRWSIYKNLVHLVSVARTLFPAPLFPLPPFQISRHVPDGLFLMTLESFVLFKNTVRICLGYIFLFVCSSLVWPSPGGPSGFYFSFSLGRHIKYEGIS